MSSELRAWDGEMYYYSAMSCAGGEIYDSIPSPGRWGKHFFFSALQSNSFEQEREKKRDPAPLPAIICHKILTACTKLCLSVCLSVCLEAVHESAKIRDVSGRPNVVLSLKPGSKHPKKQIVSDGLAIAARRDSQGVCWCW